MAITRLDKFLADSNIGTRSQVKQYIKKGLVTVNDSVTTTADIKIDTAKDIIAYQGEDINREDYVYYLFHKPAGCVSATTDNLHKTVLDYIDDSTHKDLFPLGRLDLDTEGLLIITNDGALAHQLLSPRHHVDKTYYVETDLPIPERLIAEFEEGIDIGEKHNTLPAKLEILSETTANLTLQEGKFHQVKRMFEYGGCTVTYLRRISMGGLKLDPSLKPGEYRKLSQEEIMSTLSR